MKKRSFLMAAFAAMFMASCSDNDLNQENGPQIAEKDGKMYMKVSIANPTNGSRALNPDGSEFENGDDALKENAVKEIIFAFYNDNGNYVDKTIMTYKDNPQGDLEFGNSDIEGNQSGGNVETILTMIVPVDVNAGNAIPTQVVAYVNPVKQDHSEADNLEAFGKLTRTSTQYKSGENFVMNSSVYYTGQPNAKPNVTVNIKDALKPTKTAANAPENKAITIHVERICAKVKVTKSVTDLEMNAGTSVGDVLANETTINFHPVGWALNATENNTYLLKQFRATPTDASATYTEMDSRFSDDKGMWNFPGYHRSYWCTSYGYHYSTYPKVASDVKPNPDPNLPVSYITYEDVDNQWGDVDYCLEHTVRNVGSSLAAYTSVIVAGYYTLGDDPAATFYTFGADDNEKPYVFKENATDLPKLIEGMAKSTLTIYKKESDKYIELTAGSELANVFEVTRPENLTGRPSRLVFLQLKNDLAEGTYFYDKDGVKIDVSTAKAAINESLLTGSPATKFEDGAVYYNIPIEQFGKDTSDKVIFGTYGVVRNHYYKIDVQGISGLGTAIGDKTDPIIPPTEELTYYVKTELNVLAWRVASQGVILGE